MAIYMPQFLQSRKDIFCQFILYSEPLFLTHTHNKIVITARYLLYLSLKIYPITTRQFKILGISRFISKRRIQKHIVSFMETLAYINSFIIIVINMLLDISPDCACFIWPTIQVQRKSTLGFVKIVRDGLVSLWKICW